LPRLTHTRRAAQDLEEIWLHVALDDPAAADGLLDQLGHACALLADNPALGRERAELAPGLRSFVALRAYVLFYRPVGPDIELVRVLHAARDVEALFREDPP
jgi:toxin ParE1/3/4